MIINGKSGIDRDNLLARNIANLILQGVSSDKILVLVLNSYKKERLIEKVYDLLLLSNSSVAGKLNVSTFAGIVYNSISDNWIKIEEKLKNYNGEREIYPTLCGLDASQYFLNNIIKESDFDDYFSKKNLMHQLLHRYKLIVENSLLEEELESKSLLLNETFANTALMAINKYKVMASENRFFDNLKQMSSFLYLLKSNEITDFDNVEYFFADDVDEYSYSAFEFSKYMLKKTKYSEFYLDKAGCSRQGYLCGYFGVYKDLKDEFNLKEKELNFVHPMDNDIKNLMANMLHNEDNKLDNFESYNYSKKLEMIEAVSKKIIELVDSGVDVSKIQIITPLVNDELLYLFKEFLKNKNIKLQLLTGNQKITEDIYVYAVIVILELLNQKWGISPNSFDIRILLNDIFQIPIYECKSIIIEYEKTGKLTDIDNKYPVLVNLIELLGDEDIKTADLSLQFEIIFSKIIAPNMRSNDDFEPINLLLKSISEFEKIKKNFKNLYNIELGGIDWLLHVKNSVVSQNSFKPAHIKSDAIIFSTVQKIVDFSINCDYQFWLDGSSYEWFKEDTGTIYNAWVLQKNYQNIAYTSEIGKQLTIEKNARLLRKLILNVEKKIFVYSSIFDTSGRENFGELVDFINTQENVKSEFSFIPRDDQKEILNYVGGKLAVPAVPGAGKTTIMLALLEKLVKSGENPGRILVLTYMESAARNFLNRFKKIFPKQKRFPQINTIHAFAYKILMENNNYALINIAENFSICDDGLKMSIIKEICSRQIPIGEDIEDYSNLMAAGISKSKTLGLSITELKEYGKKDIQMAEFVSIYSEYLEKMKEFSLLDYDDLLISAIKLLKENKKIAEYYQNNFKYVIEDEAQDSNKIQQKFINIISKKYNNVIRCGDVNQAILGTFSNSDVDGFKDFIQNNKKIEMFRSQRCAKKIYELANNVIEKTKSIEVLNDAFYDLKMQEVKGKNPVSASPISYKTFDKPIDEKEFIIQDIKSKLSDINNAPSIAILLRTNRQVNSWASFIENQGLNVLCRGDSYKQKKVFSFILSAIELFVQPWDNKIVAKFYKEYCNIGKLNFDKETFEFLEKCDNMVMNPAFLKTNKNISSSLEAFWWEAFSIVESQTIDVQEIIILCANRFFADVTDKSNAYLFSVLAKRYTNTLVSDEKFRLNYIFKLIKYFKNLLAQKTLKGINFFSKEDEENDIKGFVQIMTIHKAKGAEFDYVYLPEFSDYNYSLNFAKTCEKISKRKKPLLSKIEKIVQHRDIPISKNAKYEINETIRLIYVAITRAKLGLTFSLSNRNEYNRDNKPVDFVEDIVLK